MDIYVNSRKRVFVLGLGTLYPLLFRKGRMGLMFRLDYDPIVASTNVFDDSEGFISVVELGWSFWFGSWAMSIFGQSIEPDIVIEGEEPLTFKEFSIIAKNLGSKTFISPEQSE